MSRSGTNRGFLDELFSTSVGDLGRNAHFTRSSNTDSPTKTSKLLDAGLGNLSTK
jgi:hypothetical protein